MALSSPVGSPLQQRALQSLSKVAQALSTLLTIVLLIFSALALLIIPLLSSTFTEPSEPPPSLAALLPFALVVAGGTLLLVAGWRYSAVRLNFWQLVLIALGMGMGLWLGLQQLAYQDACCMFGYQIVYGYPFPGMTRSIVLEDYLTWDQVYQLMSQHPEQFTQQFTLPAMIANSAFYAHLTLIPVALLGAGLRVVRRLAH